MFTFIPLCLSTLFIPIKYSGNKWNWQEEAKEKYLNGEDNCIYSYVVKTGHGKTKFYCECAINSKKPFSYIFIKWDETVDNFINQIKELAPNSTINKGRKQIIFKINENKTVVIEKIEQEYDKFYKQIIRKCDSDLIFDEFHELHVKFGLDKYSDHCQYNNKKRKEHIKKIFDLNFINILDMVYLNDGSFRNNKIIFGSATMDNEVVEKMSIYAGMINMKNIICIPDENLIEDISIKYYIQKNIYTYILEDISKIYDDFKHKNLKINIYCSKHDECNKLVKKIKKSDIDIEDVYYSDKTDKFCVSKLKMINIFVNKCTTGVDEKSIKKIYIAREMKNSDTTPDDYKALSKLCTQTIGRIRINGEVIFVSKGKTNESGIKNYSDNILRMYEHLNSSYAKNLYNFMNIVNEYRFNKSEDIFKFDFQSYISWFMIPQLLNHCITCMNNNETFLNSSKREQEFLCGLKIILERDLYHYKLSFDDDNICKFIPQYLITLKNIIDLYISLEEGHINKQQIIHAERCGRTGFIDRSDNKEYYDKFKKEILNERYEYPFIKLSFSENTREECPQVLKEILRERCDDECELSHNPLGFESLDICRIIEGCNGGHYTEENCIVLSPDIHRIFDNGYILYTIHNNNIEFRFNDKKDVKDKVKYYYENLCKKLQFKMDSEMLKKFEKRLTQELSHG